MLGLENPAAARRVGLAVTAVFAVLVTASTAQPEADSILKQLVGVYTLTEYAAHGDEPTGRIWYESGGQMSAMLFPPGREPLTNAMSAEDYRAVMRGVVAYYGTYTIDVDAGTVTHHVQGASNPSWIGDDFVRWYRFEDGNLRLSLNSEFRNPLFWQRLR